MRDIRKIAVKATSLSSSSFWFGVMSWGEPAGVDIGVSWSGLIGTARCIRSARGVPGRLPGFRVSGVIDPNGELSANSS